VIGDLVTEINVISAKGIRELERYGGHRVSAALFDAIDAHLGGTSGGDAGLTWRRERKD